MPNLEKESIMGKLAVNCLKGFVYVSILVVSFVGGAKCADWYLENETTDEANA